MGSGLKQLVKGKAQFRYNWSMKIPFLGKMFPHISSNTNFSTDNPSFLGPPKSLRKAFALKKFLSSCVVFLQIRGKNVALS